MLFFGLHVWESHVSALWLSVMCKSSFYWRKVQQKVNGVEGFCMFLWNSRSNWIRLNQHRRWTKIVSTFGFFECVSSLGVVTGPGTRTGRPLMNNFHADTMGWGTLERPLSFDNGKHDESNWITEFWGIHGYPILRQARSNSTRVSELYTKLMRSEFFSVLERA